MKHTLWITALSLGLAATACKDDEQVELRPDEAQERLNTQRADLRDPDVNEDVDLNTDDDGDWERTKAEMRARLAQIDAKLEQLAARTDEESKQAAATLRQRRDQLSADLDRTEDRADTGWEDFKAQVRSGFDELEKELDSAVD
jgi:hypothetical protein